MDKPFPAYEGDEPYIFVCYAHDNAKIIYPEIRWLRDQGVNIWYDEGIRPGAEFPEHLSNAILGARLVLFFVSPRSVNSRHCRDEVYFALDHDTPVLASHIARTELPPGLALSIGTTQALVRHEMPLHEYRQKLLAGISSMSGRPASVAAPQPPPVPSLRSRVTRLAVPLGVVLVVATVGLAAFAVRQTFDRHAEIRWARDELLPQIRRLVDEQWRDYTAPYALALRAEEIIPGDPQLGEIFDTIALHINIDSEPQAADVYMKVYARPEDEWLHVGVTPIEKLRVPVGIFRWKFQKEGYETVLAAASSWDINLSDSDLLVPSHLIRTLDRSSEIPAGMVRVHGATTPHGNVSDFFMDRYEVTNAAFQKFVAGGGYRKRDYWRHPFMEDGRELEWEEAMARFVDQTGRPGPSDWLGGTFPDGQADHPVSVSWYEAAAYAEFVGKSLPTGTHWGIARGEYSPLIKYPQLGGYAVFAPFSNFSTSGTVAVGSLPGITAYGSYDQAGNAREWCSNDTSLGKLVRGGAWNDNPYRFAAFSQAPPMFREPAYGFRLVLYPDDAKGPQAAFAEVPIVAPDDFYRRAAVSDEVFDVYKRQFDYDDVGLDVRRESLDDGAGLWTLERVSVATPYGDDRMIINLFLPKTAAPPYQAVIYFPGSASLFQDSSEHIDEYHEFPIFLSFLVNSGRAVVYPVYQGTFERRGDPYPALHTGPASHAYTAYLVQLVKDFRRTIDYLERRDDIDPDRLAFYGMSWGAMLGTIIPAVEQRPKAAILVAGGLLNMGLPEANPLNYVPRITMPMLMLSGRYDSLLGYEPSVLPLFDLIGTADEHKVLKVYETDHIPPKRDYVAETLRWLDRYLGPVD